MKIHQNSHIMLYNRLQIRLYRMQINERLGLEKQLPKTQHMKLLKGQFTVLYQVYRMLRDSRNRQSTR